jgi:ribosome-binding protein aMBF1 (putative translation factor)
MNNIKSTNDGLEILYNRYYKNNPERQLELEKIRLDDQVSREICNLKKVYNLSNQDLAKLINTEESIIESLENGDYEEDSFLMLNIIATALKMRVKFEVILA